MPFSISHSSPTVPVLLSRIFRHKTNYLNFICSFILAGSGSVTIILDPDPGIVLDPQHNTGLKDSLLTLFLKKAFEIRKIETK